MNPNFCPTCHTAIPDHAPGGFCPACLLRDADDSPTLVRLAPSVAEISEAFPQWEILALIGEGGMGFVYQIRQPALDRIVALKILSPELSRDPAFAERFAREARVLGKLNHPNIVTVYESGESGGFFYLVMEYVDGVNLRQAMRAGRFTPQQALAVVPGICDALQAAHAQGVWHRDIKPENILLDAQGNVKIVDFGIARLVGDPRRDFTLTRTGAALGSAAYMAPEQHEKPHDVDHRADIYSLGVVIYEMLTGELPLGRFPAPSAKSAVDARIDEIVFRTLEKEREMRQQSATEVKTDMQNAAVAPKLPTPSVIDFSSWKLVLAAVVFSYIGTAWNIFTGADGMRSTLVGFAGCWLNDSSSFDDSYTRLELSPTYSLIAMFLAGACWLRWFWLKRVRVEQHASFLHVSGPHILLKMSCVWISSVAFFLWAWMALTGIYLYFGRLITDPNNLRVPVLKFLIAGVVSGTVWTLFKTLHASSSLNSSKTSDSTHEKENVVRKQTVADEADSHKEIPSIQPAIILHAILFVVVAVILIIVPPRFAEIFREMDVSRSQIPIVGVFRTVQGVILIPVLFGIDVGLCFLARKMGGRRGLRLWSVTVILSMVAAIGATSVVLSMRLKNVIDTFGGPASAENSNRAAEEERWVAETYREAQGQLEALKRNFPDFSTPQGAVIAYQVGLETQNSGAVLAAIPKSVVQSAVSPSNYVEELIAAHQAFKNSSKGVAILTYVNILDPVPESGTMDRYSQKRILGRDPGVTVVVQFKLSYLGGTMTSTEICVQEGKEWRVIPNEEPTQKLTQSAKLTPFLDWAQGEWLLDGDASKHGVSNIPITKNLTDALANIQASEIGQMLLTITPEQIAWTTKSEKAWKPTQELRMENGSAFLLLKLPDGRASTMVRFDRHDENTLLITPLEGDRTSNGPVPRYTLVFKRKSFGNAEKNQESILEFKSVFGPVVERSLYFSDNMRAYLDFQSGESSRAQWALSAIPTDEAQKTWLKQTGVDAYAIEPITNKPDQSGVVVHEHPRLSSWSGGCVFALVPHSQSFESPLAEDMEACLKDAADTQALMGGTYWFKTSDGAKGIVHLYGINDSPPQVQLRYRIFVANDVVKEVESWSYTLRHLDAQKLEQQMKASPQAGVTTKVEAGVVTVTGRPDVVRWAATFLRSIDQPEVKDPLQLPLFNMPPDFFTRLAMPVLMSGDEWKDSQFEPAFFETLKRENITAPQLARALRSHVLELEKATFVNTGTPFESIVKTPGASTYYDATIPCSDQPDKPLTFRIRRTTQQIGTKPDIAGFAPWLIEEAKKQSKEPITSSNKNAEQAEVKNVAARTLAQDAAMLAATKGKLWKSDELDMRRANGVQFQQILVLEFAPFAGNRENPPQASVKVSSASPTVKEGPITLSVGIGGADFKDVRLTEKDGIRKIKITQAIETVDHPTKKTERILNDYRSMSFEYILTADTLTLKGFSTDEITWGSIGFIAPTRDIVFKLQP